LGINALRLVAYICTTQKGKQVSCYRLIGMTIAVLGASSVLAASAAAEEASPAVWLANGESVTSSLGIHTEGEITLEDTKVATGMKCSIILVGTVTTGGKGESPPF
jgi:hypothetical protein